MGIRDGTTEAVIVCPAKLAQDFRAFTLLRHDKLTRY